MDDLVIVRTLRDEIFNRFDRGFSKPYEDALRWVLNKIDIIVEKQMIEDTN